MTRFWLAALLAVMDPSPTDGKVMVSSIPIRPALPPSGRFVFVGKNGKSILSIGIDGVVEVNEKKVAGDDSKIYWQLKSFLEHECGKDNTPPEPGPWR